LAVNVVVLLLLLFD